MSLSTEQVAVLLRAQEQASATFAKVAGHLEAMAKAAAGVSQASEALAAAVSAAAGFERFVALPKPRRMMAWPRSKRDEEIDRVIDGLIFRAPGRCYSPRCCRVFLADRRQRDRPLTG